MLRKMLLIAAAVAIPMGATAVTTVVQSGTAGATALSITCKNTGGAVDFALPGVSNNGSFSSSPTSTTTTTASTFNCGSAGTGKSKGMSIVSNSTPCTGTNTPVTGCSVGQYNYDSASAFGSSGSQLAAEIPKLKIVIGTTTYITKTVSSAVTLCSGGEAGFVLKGKLTSPAAHAGEAAKLTVCLGSDTGSGTTGSFTKDYTNISTDGATIATANFASDTKVKIS
jgi:hypothetical protein